MNRMTRRRFIGAALATGPVLGCVGRAEDAVELDAGRPVFAAPQDPGRWAAFREALERWREEERLRLKYDIRTYARAEFAWVSRCYACCFLMVCDEAFYDVAGDRYRVKEFLEEGRREFGGYDAVVLWHAYPRIGVDARNQFEFYRDMPGGVLGVREVVREFRAAGVRVFIDYNPWDTGTRREAKEDLDVLATLMQALEADGIFLDTMDRGAAAFRSRLDAIRPGLVLEGELALPVERVFDHHLSWAQWFEDDEVPGVLRNKWFERRHMQHQIRRWDASHVAELHMAWMNGSGMMVWENVFGSWVGWSPRDRSMLRSMLPIQRRYTGLFAGEQWTPLVPTQLREVYASLWEGDGIRLWTLVNRSDRDIRGEELLRVPVGVQERVDDLILGGGMHLARAGGGPARVIGDLAAQGIGCVIAGTMESLGEGYLEFLESQELLARRADRAVVAERRPTMLKEVSRTKRRWTAPKGMVAVKGGDAVLRSVMRVRECGFYESEPKPGHRLGDSYRIQLEWFERKAVLGRYAMDEAPVTNAQYAEFLRGSGYRPRHPENFLKHWGHGHAPYGEEEHPVVYVGLEDARAYAEWAGKRLPTEEEWQWAAEGAERRVYPWGYQMEPGRCNDGSGGEKTTAVRAFPGGRTPSGIYDLCGNVWEWTESERTDGRTRFCILKGGSYYAAKGSNWYFDGGPQANAYAAKFLLMWPGMDRCATVGFRCVVDLRG